MKTSTIILSLLSLVASQGNTTPYERPVSGKESKTGQSIPDLKSVGSEPSDFLSEFGSGTSTNPLLSGLATSKDGDDDTKKTKLEAPGPLKPALKNFNSTGCGIGMNRDCPTSPANIQDNQSVLTENKTLLSNMTVAVAIDTQTKQENLLLTSAVQIIQKKLEVGQITYEERQDDSSVKAHATIHFESMEELNAIYTSEEIKNSKKEDQETLKEAKLAACFSKVISESKEFDLKGQEIISVSIQVDNQAIGQTKETKTQNNLVQQNDPKSGINSSGASYISREHKVAVVKSVSEATQLERKVNYVDISKSEDRKAVNYLVHQVDQTEVQFAESVQRFVKENGESKSETQASMLAKQMKQECSKQQQGGNQVQSCLKEYVEKELVIYDSKLAKTEIKSTKQAVKDSDKLSFATPKCSGCSNGGTASFPKYKEFNISPKKLIPTKEEVSAKVNSNKSLNLQGNSIEKNIPQTSGNTQESGINGGKTDLAKIPGVEGALLKEEKTALSNITVAVAINKKTKNEDLQLTSIVQIIQKKLETKMVTYEERQEGTSTKGHVTIYFETKEQLEAIYTTEELKHVKKEEKDAFKEAAFVSCVGKVLVDSKTFNFKNQESIYVGIQVKNHTVAQIQGSSVEKQAVVQSKSSSDNSAALYISRVHQVALVKSETEVAQLDKDVNHIDVSSTQDKQAVSYLFRQVDQTKVQFVEKIQFFITQHINSKTGTRQTTMLARQMKAVCIDKIQDRSRVQMCLMEYVEKKLVIYDSKLVNTEIKSTERAVRDNDKLQYNKDCSDCSKGKISTFPMSQRYNISKQKPTPTKKEIQAKRAGFSIFDDDFMKDFDSFGSFGNFNDRSKSLSNNSKPSQESGNDDFFNKMLKKFGMSGFKGFNMDNFKNFFGSKN